MAQNSVMPENPTQTIFVVDDESIVSSTLAMILNSSGYRATSFTSAEDAIKATELNYPELPLVAVPMPGMNGIDLAIRFHSLCPKCKVLLFSGALNSGNLLEEAKQKGYDFQILAKPVHPKDMLAAIRNS
jgi:DNA-binding NtrC family response regulator